MNAKELMIWDWVYSEYLKTNARVLTVTPDYVEVSPCPSMCDSRNPYESIKPIPLTAEILEKNGWDVEYTCYAKCNLPDTYSSLDFYFYESRLRKWWEGVDEWDNHNKVRDITFQCHCSYVHELQHALRLCGLSELADNFKID